MAFAIGILPEAWEKIAQGIKFDIDVLAQGEKDTIFSRVLQPKRNIGDRGWHNFIVPLDKYAGKSVSITFSTSGSGDDLSYGWAAWGWGKIVRMENKIIDNKTDTTVSNDTFSDVFSSDEERFGNKRGEITSVELLDEKLNPTNFFKSGDIAKVRIHFLLHENINENLTVGCTFKNKYCDIYGTNTRWQRLDLSNKKRGAQYIVEFSQSLKINSGTYSINAGLVIVHPDIGIEVMDRRYDCLIFRVEKADPMVGIVDLGSSVKEIKK